MPVNDMVFSSVEIAVEEPSDENSLEVNDLIPPQLLKKYDRSVSHSQCIESKKRHFDNLPLVD